MSITLTEFEAEQVRTILSRRANEIAGYIAEHTGELYPCNTPLEKRMPASVEYGLHLEVERLRGIATKIEKQQTKTEGE